MKKATENLENFELESDGDNEDLAAAEEAIADDQIEQDDDGQIGHDREVVRSSRDQAVYDMRTFYKVQMTGVEEKTALQIFPAVLFFHFLKLLSKLLIFILSRWLAWLDEFMTSQF